MEKQITEDNIDRLLDATQTEKHSERKSWEIVDSQELSNKLNIELKISSYENNTIEFIIAIHNLSDIRLLFYPNGYLTDGIYYWNESINKKRQLSYDMLMSGENNGIILELGEKVEKRERSLIRCHETENELFLPKIDFQEKKLHFQYFAYVNDSYFCPYSHKRIKEIELDAKNKKAELWKGYSKSNIVIIERDITIAST